jgi:phosphatidylglycerol:prolipoprotein diacylglycerol transferase
MLYIIVEFRAFLYDPWGAISGSGFVLYGGIIGGVCAAMIYCRAKNLIL